MWKSCALLCWLMGIASQYVYSYRRFLFHHNSQLLLSSARSPGIAADSHSIEVLTIPPIKRFQGEIRLPGSKSLSNRAILLAALSEGTTVIDNVVECADTMHMLQALQQLHIDIDQTQLSSKQRLTIRGNNGCFSLPKADQNVSKTLTLDLGNAGTVMRPLTAVLAASSQGHFVLDGTERMRERPIQDLVSALKQLGVNVSCSDTGCPPVSIHAQGIHGGVTNISGKISSQYISALLLAAPLSTQTVTINVRDTLTSAPYVDMTLRLMKQFGIDVTTTINPNYNSEHDSIDSNAFSRKYVIHPGRYASPGHVHIEGDASSASYFLAAAVLCPDDENNTDEANSSNNNHSNNDDNDSTVSNKHAESPAAVTVYGISDTTHQPSVQGDVRFIQILQKMGASVTYNDSQRSITIFRNKGVVLQGIEEDCGDIPDVAMTLAIVGIFARGKTTIKNVYNWRLKESERMVAIVTEMRKLGVHVEESMDSLVVHGIVPLETDTTAHVHQSNGSGNDDDDSKSESSLVASPTTSTLRDHVTIETYNDHRMAMCFSLLACANITVHIRDPNCVQKTFPEFFTQFRAMSIH